MRKEVLSVQTWTVDVALPEIDRRRLEDLEHSHGGNFRAQIRRLEPFCISSKRPLRHCAADGPGNFFARDEHMRITAAWIDDVLTAFQVVKMAGPPAVAAADGL